MSTRELLTYISALVLGLLTLFPYFVYGGGEVSSWLTVWTLMVAYAAGLFGLLGLSGKLKFQLVVVYCLPVTAISLILGTAESPTIGFGLTVAAVPILCVWTGASLAWLLFRYCHRRA